MGHPFETFGILAPSHPDEGRQVTVDEEDARLVERILAAIPARDDAAEAALYRRLAPRLRLYGRKHLRDAHLAEDLAQQVMVLVLERLRAGTLRDPARVASFALGCCRRVVIDLRRTAARRERLLERYGSDLTSDDAGEVTYVDRERLLGCLERLPERERAVVIVSFFEMKDSDAVGRDMNLSPGNVRVIRHRAIGRLRECMGAGGLQ